MHKIILNSLEAVGLDVAGIGNNENLENRGLDSLMTVLLLSKLEENLGRNIDVSNFKQEHFSTIDSINTFLTSGNQ